MAQPSDLDPATHQPLEENYALWEKLNNETPKAYSAFLTYRNQPASKRSIRNTVKELYGELIPSKVRQFQTWSARYSWVARSSAWDEELDRQEREEQIKAVKEMRKRQAKIAQALEQKAVERLRSLKPEDLSIGEVLSFITNGFRLEAGALGEPQEIQRVQQIGLNMNVDYSALKDEDLRNILARQIEDKSFPKVDPPKPVEDGIDSEADA